MRDLLPNHGATSRALALVLAISPATTHQRGLAQDEIVPEVHAADLAGVVRALEDFRGKVTLLLFWQPDNERSRAALCAVADLVRRYEPAAFASIVSGPHTKSEIEQALGACPHKAAVLLDPDRALFGSFQIVALPTLMMVGADRRLKWKIAGFGTEGLGRIQANLDEIFQRHKPAALASEGPAEATRRFALAQQFLKRGMAAQGDAILRSLTESHSQFRPAWVAMGYRHIVDGRVDDAQACFEKAFGLDPRNSDVAPGLAWVWRKKGDSKRSGKWAGLADPADPHYDLVSQAKAEP